MINKKIRKTKNTKNAQGQKGFLLLNFFVFFVLSAFLGMRVTTMRDFTNSLKINQLPCLVRHYL
jgi:hypothetical protein